MATEYIDGIPTTFDWDALRTRSANVDADYARWIQAIYDIAARHRGEIEWVRDYSREIDQGITPVKPRLMNRQQRRLNSVSKTRATATTPKAKTVTTQAERERIMLERGIYVPQNPAVKERTRAMIRSRELLTPTKVSNVRDLTQSEARDCALRLLEDRDACRVFNGNSRQLDTLEEVFRSNAEVARLAIVTERPAYRTAFMRYLRDGDRAIYSQEEQASLLTYWEQVGKVRAQAEGTLGSGGYAVPPFIDPTIIITDGAPNPYMVLGTVSDIGSNEWKGIVSAAPAWSFDQESSEVSDDAMGAMAGPAIPVYTARGFVKYTIEIGEDYPDFAAQMGKALAAGYRTLLSQKLTTGSGTNEPTGILTALDAASPSVVVASAVDGAFTDTDIQATWNALPAQHQENAVWMASSSAASHYRMASALYHASTVPLRGDVNATEIINAKPLIEQPYFDAWSSTTGANTRVVVGDWSCFQIVQRRGLTIENVGLVPNTSHNRPDGTKGLLATARLGADVTNPDAFRVQANT